MAVINDVVIILFFVLKSFALGVVVLWFTCCYIVLVALNCWLSLLDLFECWIGFGLGVLVLLVVVF